MNFTRNEVNTKKPITPTELLILKFLTEERICPEVAEMLNIQNTSAGGHLARLYKKGMIQSRKVKTKPRDSWITSRKRYSLTDKGKDILKSEFQTLTQSTRFK